MKSQPSDYKFKLVSKNLPTGDQPQAIEQVCQAFNGGDQHHVLLGVTGSGKTFTMANVIAEFNKPTLVIAPNKTLAAQLFTEFRELFPENAVGFFISYYDYYQPEAYVPSTDTYIAKDALINDDIDKMRHAATQYLFERKDVLIVASVSCIYGLGSPASYANLVFKLQVGDKIPRNKLLSELINIQYSRNDSSLLRGHFRVRGDTIDILPANQRDEAVRVECFDDHVESIGIIDALTGVGKRSIEQVAIYPNSHYVTDRTDMQQIVREILTDLGIRLREFKEQNKQIEYQRLEQRTMRDVELLEQLNWCPGIENYSRYLTGLPPGHPPPCLLNYYPEDFLIIIDESHITVPQIQGMFRGDRARKQVLVDFGFRLPSALDNRPLNFDEFLKAAHQILYVSATPSSLELNLAHGHYSEQVIRPTGLVDPKIEIRRASSQIDDLYAEINKVVATHRRVLVTTLTKRMAEDMTQYYRELGIKVRYLHSEIDSIERVELLRDLRKGEFDVLIGINLLREGLDLPEVKLVAVMDADKEGFLRSRSSLIQIVGRAARNAEGYVIFYADHLTQSMQQCIDETERRRQKQLMHNKANNITPQSIVKDVPLGLREMYGLVNNEQPTVIESPAELLETYKIKKPEQLEQLIKKQTKKMKKLAEQLEFEQATELRNEIATLKELLLFISQRENSV